MTYGENEPIKLYENIYDIHKEPNEFIPFNGLLIKNDKNIDSIFFNNFKIENIFNQKNSDQKNQKDSKDLIPKLEIIKDKNEEKDNSIPSIYYFEDILQKFQNNDNEKNKLEELFKEINFVGKIEEVKKRIQILENKRKASDCYNDFDYDLKNPKKTVEKSNQNNQNTIKRGRKVEKHTNIKTHDKMMPDNIIKKIKGKIFEYAILFLNTIANRTKEKEKLLNLDYKYINRINRKEDLEYLNMKLKDLFSKDISSKYTTKKKNFNKKLIKKLLNNSEDETIKFSFNITLRDWLDLFTLRKTVEELLKEESDKIIDCEKIKKSIYNVDVFLNKIKEKNGQEYLTPFIFLLYNYERWFSIKKQRIIKKK